MPYTDDYRVKKTNRFTTHSAFATVLLISLINTKRCVDINKNIYRECEEAYGVPEGNAVDKRHVNNENVDACCC